MSRDAVTVLASYAALLAATGHDPVVAHEVGPTLLAPPLRLGDAVVFRRLNQLGWSGAFCLGPDADVEALLSGPWRQHPGWEDVRSITAPRRHRHVLEAIGVRGIGEWDWMSLTPGALVRRAAPLDVEVTVGFDPQTALAFVARHHGTRWVTPDPVTPVWVGLHDGSGELPGGAGELLAVGQTSLAPGGTDRLASIVVHPEHRGRGLGRATTQALVDLALTRSPAVILGVDQDNPAGRALYASMGFHLDHELASGALP